MITALLLATAAAVCPFDGHFRTRAAIEAQVSRVTEQVATASRHRAVVPPSITYPANRNFVDTEIFGKMKSAHITPAKQSGDEEFLRRVTIDIAARIPTPAEAKEFLADTSADKRDKLIETLLASDDYNARWSIWLGDLVQNAYDASNIGTGVIQGRGPYYHWMRDSIAAHKPYDQLVRELLTSSGSQLTNPPANYFVRLYQENGPPQDTYDNLATQTGAQFLAQPMMCVSCHDGRGHLELLNVGMSQIKRQQLWGMAAFFARVHVGVQTSGQLAWLAVSEDDNGEYRLNTTTGNKSTRAPASGASEVVDPVYMFGGGRPADGENRRAAYARLLTSDPQFARATVNYIWKELFGLGIVEPVDNFDLASKTQASHPALLDQLATYFVQNGYDLRALMRLIVQSNAYQLSSRYDGQWNAAWTSYYARHYPRRMMAEVLLDSIYSATGRTFSCNAQGNDGVITRAIDTPDSYAFLNVGCDQAAFLIDFGEGDRDSNLRNSDPALLNVLEMLNDRQVLDGLVTVTSKGSTSLIAQLLKANTQPADAVDTVYWAALSRPPSDDERAAAVAYLNGGTYADRLADLQFVLLNKVEFLFY